MENRSIKMSKREWARIDFAAKLCGESRNSFVRRVAHAKAMLVYIEKNLHVVESFIGDSFDNYIMRSEKKFTKFEQE